jgi:Domain of unknown function (DUF4333)
VSAERASSLVGAKRRARSFARPGVACLAVAALVTLAGCGYDAEKLEGDISDGFGSELRKFDVTADSVRCPEEIDEDEGYRFECMLTTDTGQELPVEARVIDGGDIEYRFGRKALRELAFGGGGGRSARPDS